MEIRVEGLTKTYGDLVVFRDLDVTLPTTGITAILGPSGCGKTTLLHAIAGLVRPDAGSIRGLEGRRVSYLFQEPRLLPWKTVRGNLEVVLQTVLEPGELAARVDRFLAMVDLQAFSHTYPHELSGGMRQRLAIARAFAYPGEALLMDEPFQALDLALKLTLVREFERLWLLEPRPAVFVTHDVHEALVLGDTILVFTARPAAVRRVVVNTVPRGSRVLADPKMLELERVLYTAFLGGD